jgi:hypothetical protein
METTQTTQHPIPEHPNPLQNHYQNPLEMIKKYLPYVGITARIKVVGIRGNIHPTIAILQEQCG